jgi:hypothetical protein
MVEVVHRHAQVLGRAASLDAAHLGDGHQQRILGRIQSGGVALRTLGERLGPVLAAHFCGEE